MVSKDIKAFASSLDNEKLEFLEFNQQTDIDHESYRRFKLFSQIEDSNPKAATDIRNAGNVSKEQLKKLEEDASNPFLTPPPAPSTPSFRLSGGSSLRSLIDNHDRSKAREQLNSADTLSAVKNAQRSNAGAAGRSSLQPEVPSAPSAEPRHLVSALGQVSSAAMAPGATILDSRAFVHKPNGRQMPQASTRSAADPARAAAATSAHNQIPPPAPQPAAYQQTAATAGPQLNAAAVFAPAPRQPSRGSIKDLVSSRPAETPVSAPPQPAAAQMPHVSSPVSAAPAVPGYFAAGASTAAAYNSSVPPDIRPQAQPYQADSPYGMLFGSGGNPAAAREVPLMEIYQRIAACQ